MAAAILKKVNQWLQLISGNNFLLYFLESKANIDFLISYWRRCTSADECIYHDDGKELSVYINLYTRLKGMYYTDPIF